MWPSGPAAMPSPCAPDGTPARCTCVVPSGSIRATPPISAPQSAPSGPVASAPGAEPALNGVGSPSRNTLAPRAYHSESSGPAASADGRAADVAPRDHAGRRDAADAAGAAALDEPQRTVGARDQRARVRARAQAGRERRGRVPAVDPRDGVGIAVLALDGHPQPPVRAAGQRRRAAVAFEPETRDAAAGRDPAEVLAARQREPQRAAGRRPARSGRRSALRFCVIPPVNSRHHAGGRHPGDRPGVRRLGDPHRVVGAARDRLAGAREPGHGDRHGLGRGGHRRRGQKAAEHQKNDRYAHPQEVRRKPRGG